MKTTIKSMRTKALALAVIGALAAALAVAGGGIGTSPGRGGTGPAVSSR